MADTKTRTKTFGGKHVHQETQLALMAQSIGNIEKAMSEMNKKIEGINDNLISREEFTRLEAKVEKTEARSDLHVQELGIMKNDFGNVKRIVYGAVGIVLTAVVVALLGLIIIQTS